MTAKVIRRNDEDDPTGVRCPFTGARLHADEEAELEPPPTLLFAYYGMVGEYAHLRRRAPVLRGLLGRDCDDPTPEELIPLLPRTVVVIESDGGWNGVNWYGFVEPAREARKQAENKQAGRKQAGRKQAGRKQAGRKQAGRKQAGRKQA